MEKQKLICPHCKEELHLSLEIQGDVGCCGSERCYCSYPYLSAFADHQKTLPKTGGCDFNREVLHSKGWYKNSFQRENILQGEDEISSLLNSDRTFQDVLNDLWNRWQQKKNKK